MKMGPRLDILLTIVMIIVESLADDHDETSKCCDDVNITASGCHATEVVVFGHNHLFVRRSDRATFIVDMSRSELVPRSSHQFRTRSDTLFRCTNCEITRIAMTLDNEDVLFVRRRYPSGNFIHLESRNGYWENGWRDGFRRECNSTVPVILRRLFNCGNKTHDDNYFLHHVGTFNSRDRKNTTLVGYYRRHGDVGSDGWRTRVVAWNEHGGNSTDIEYLDRSGTVSLTGWREKDGKELIVSINSFGHVCFFYRSYDSPDFRPPGKGDKFMPDCLPANMLFGCPQSFCYTGLVDEIVESETLSGFEVTLVRGLWWQRCQRSHEIKPGRTLRLEHCGRTTMLSSCRYFGVQTVAAAYSLNEGTEM